jgi:hypothetical protein
MDHRSIISISPNTGRRSRSPGLVSEIGENYRGQFIAVRARISTQRFTSTLRAVLLSKLQPNQERAAAVSRTRAPRLNDDDDDDPFASLLEGDDGDGDDDPFASPLGGDVDSRTPSLPHTHPPAESVFDKGVQSLTFLL